MCDNPEHLKLIESEEKYRSIVEMANEIIFVLQDYKIIFANEFACNAVGYTKDELNSMNPFGFIYPGDKKQVKEYYNKRIKNDDIADVPDYLFRIVHKNGDIKWVKITSSVIKKWNGTGKKAIVMFLIDVTEIKKMEEEILKMEKMESLGLLASGVAHEFNNILSIITGYAQLLQLKIESSDPDNIKSDINNILDASGTAISMVDDLLLSARNCVNKQSVINLNDIINKCLLSDEVRKLKAVLPSLEIKTDLKSELFILGSQPHIHKTLINLCNNAVGSMKVGETILTITTEDKNIYHPIKGYDNVVPGDYVMLKVTDTGEYICENDLARIFEPFYTKRVMGRPGTGLGLSVVWGTVKDHHGYINVSSEHGIGNTFTLYFPISRKELYEEKLPESTNWYMGSGQSILIVDDNEQQRVLANTMLSKMNYSTETLSSGEEAIEYIRQNDVDLILLDMDMSPNMNGLDTFKEIISINPEQNVIIVSGDIESTNVKTALDLDAHFAIQKPYKLDNLCLQVYKLFNII